jgi:hypothetical protein
MTLVCSACGSTSVARKAWVDVNDDSLIETLGDVPRCFDCAEDTTTIDATAYAAREGFDELSAEIRDEEVSDADV